METQIERPSQDQAFWRQLESSRASEARLSLILEGVQDHAVSMLDASGAIVTWNAAAERIKGYRLEDVRGQHIRFVFTEQDRARGVPEAELDVARRTGKYQGDGWRQRKDGSLFYANVSLSALRDEDGNVTGFVKVTHDITERLLAQRGLELLSDVSACMAATFEEPDRLVAQFAQVLLRNFSEFIAVEMVDEFGAVDSVYLRHIDPEREQVLLALPRSSPTGKRSLIASAPSEAAIRRSGAELFENEGLSANRAALVAKSAPRHALLLPLLARGRTLGVLALGRDARPFDAADIRLGEEVARRLSLAVDSGRLLDLAQAGERRLHLALEAGRMGAWEWDISRNRVTWSPTLEDIHGIARGSFAGTFEAYTADMHPEDRERVLTALQAALRQGTTHHVTYRIVRPDGQTRWLDAHATVSRDVTGGALRLVGVCADVTERLLAQETLIASERRFRAVFDNALDGMLLTSEAGLVLDANPAACSLLGLAPEHLIGRALLDFIVPGPNTAAPRASGTALERGEMRVLRNDGTILDVEHSTTAHIVPGQHFSVWRDVTARRRSEESLSFLADASKTLASTLDYRVAIANAVKLAVPRIADLANVDMLEPDGTLNRVAVAHADPERVELVRELWRRWPDNEKNEHGAGKVVRTGVSELHADVSDTLLAQRVSDPDLLERVRAIGLRSSICVPLLVRGRAIGAMTLLSAESGRRFGNHDLAIAEDLGRRLAIAVENARLYDSEQQARRNADTANRAKDEFLATISHELRTPLNAMLGWTRILRSGALEATKHNKALETIERNAVNQAQLIEDLLDVSRIISGKLRLNVESTDLVHVIEQTVDSLRPASEAKAITMLCDLVPRPATILGDEHRLQQVVWNLLSNAIKFTPSGGHVVITLKRSSAGYEFTVSDTGCGIKPDFLPVVFERFKQADGATTRAHGGLGLGLAISRHIVELHGGTIEVSSQGEGKGSTFTVVFPTSVTATEPAVESSRGSTQRIEKRPEFAGLTVLVIDDDVDGRELVGSVLSDCGLQVISAGNAIEGLAALQRSKPDLLLSDIGLPGEDGYSLIRKVRALPHEQGGGIPAAALTAYARIEDRRKALDAGYMMHLSKPIEPAELVAVVTNLLRFAAR
ncbi:MAG TPA: PAS domain S-box protein [Polyangiaceae bacterium]|jgi:PAS domain S-box-containing protein|nr:PAS domain S-box protein [Polyangiaceae bacterium]